MATDITIRYTDLDKTPTPEIELERGVLDTTSTSLRLYGEEAFDYGDFFQENILHLYENFADTTEPDNATEGQSWYDSSAGTLKISRVDVPFTPEIPANPPVILAPIPPVPEVIQQRTIGTIVSSEEPPVSTSYLWHDTNTDFVNHYLGNEWKPISYRYVQRADGEVTDLVMSAGSDILLYGNSYIEAIESFNSTTTINVIENDLFVGIDGTSVTTIEDILVSGSSIKVNIDARSEDVTALHGRNLSVRSQRYLDFIFDTDDDNPNSKLEFIRHSNQSIMTVNKTKIDITSPTNLNSKQIKNLAAPSASQAARLTELDVVEATLDDFVLLSGDTVTGLLTATDQLNVVNVLDLPYAGFSESAGKDKTGGGLALRTIPSDAPVMLKSWNGHKMLLLRKPDLEYTQEEYNVEQQGGEPDHRQILAEFNAADGTTLFLNNPSTSTETAKTRTWVAEMVAPVRDLDGVYKQYVDDELATLEADGITAGLDLTGPKAWFHWANQQPFYSVASYNIGSASDPTDGQFSVNGSGAVEFDIPFLLDKDNVAVIVASTRLNPYTPHEGSGTIDESNTFEVMNTTWSLADNTSSKTFTLQAGKMSNKVETGYNFEKVDDTRIGLGGGGFSGDDPNHNEMFGASFPGTNLMFAMDTEQNGGGSKNGLKTFNNPGNIGRIGGGKSTPIFDVRYGHDRFAVVAEDGVSFGVPTIDLSTTVNFPKFEDPGSRVTRPKAAFPVGDRWMVVGEATSHSGNDIFLSTVTQPTTFGVVNYNQFTRILQADLTGTGSHGGDKPVDGDDLITGVSGISSSVSQNPWVYVIDATGRVFWSSMDATGYTLAYFTQSAFTFNNYSVTFEGHPVSGQPYGVDDGNEIALFNSKDDGMFWGEGGELTHLSIFGGGGINYEISYANGLFFIWRQGSNELWATTNPKSNVKGDTLDTWMDVSTTYGFQTPTAIRFLLASRSYISAMDGNDQARSRRIEYVAEEQAFQTYVQENMTDWLNTDIGIDILFFWKE